MLEAIIIFALGYYLGHRIATLFHVAAFKKILEELGVTNTQLRELGQRAARELGVPFPQEDPSKNSEHSLREVHVKLEQHQGQIYAFRKDDDSFLAQGTDRAALIDRLNQTMKPCRVIVAREDGADLLQENNSQNA